MPCFCVSQIIELTASLRMSFTGGPSHSSYPFSDAPPIASSSRNWQWWLSCAVHDGWRFAATVVLISYLFDLTFDRFCFVPCVSCFQKSPPIAASGGNRSRTSPSRSRGSGGKVPVSLYAESLNSPMRILETEGMTHDQLHSYIEDLKRQSAFLSSDISDLERREQILNLGRANLDVCLACEWDGYRFFFAV